MNAFVAPQLNPGFLGFWSWDNRTGFVRADPRLNGYFGIDTVGGEVACIDDYELRVHPDDLEWLRYERPRCIGPSGHGVLEYRVIDDAGRVRWVMCRAIYGTDDDGNILEGHGMVMDITDFKADGNSCRSAPAPLANPLQSLIDSSLEAHRAAQQVGDPDIIRSIEAVLMVSARLLSERMVRQVAETQH